QGEELGLTEADLAFEDLRDPYRIRFWPQFKGRAGCRTPMVWSAGARNGGFSQERPWLPVPEEHLGKAVDVPRGGEASLLAHYRRFLACRRLHPALVRGDINFLPSEGETIAFTRGNGTDRLVCVFNLASHPALVDLGSDLRLQPVSGHGFAGEAEAGRVRLGPYGARFGRMVCMPEVEFKRGPELRLAWLRPAQIGMGDGMHAGLVEAPPVAAMTDTDRQFGKPLHRLAIGGAVGIGQVVDQHVIVDGVAAEQNSVTLVIKRNGIWRMAG